MGTLRNGSMLSSPHLDRARDSTMAPVETRYTQAQVAWACANRSGGMMLRFTETANSDARNPTTSNDRHRAYSANRAHSSVEWQRYPVATISRGMTLRAVGFAVLSIVLATNLPTFAAGTNAQNQKTQKEGAGIRCRPASRSSLRFAGHLTGPSHKCGCMAAELCRNDDNKHSL